jgi:hypothetical protein
MSTVTSGKSIYTTGATSGARTAYPYLCSPPVLVGVRVAQFFVLCVCFVDRCLSFCTCFFWPLYCLSFFDLRILITSLISWNPSWFPQSRPGNQLYYTWTRQLLCFCNVIILELRLLITSCGMFTLLYWTI